MIQELQELGFKFELVLADSLYEENDTNFISILSQFKLKYLVATLKSDLLLFCDYDLL